jgi:hypothetical protein
MSLQKAIDILEEYHKTAGRYKASHDIVIGVSMCISLLKDELDSECTHTWEPSEDTEYKKSLTAWIKTKQIRANQPAIELINELLQRPDSEEETEAFDTLMIALEEGEG